MIRSRRSAGRSRVALAALVTAGGLVLAGCAAGQQAQTAVQRSTIDGVNAEAGPIALRNVAIEYPDNGLYRKGTVARLRLLIANTGNAADELTEVRTDVAGEVSIVGAQAESASSPSVAATPTATASATPSGSATASGSGTPSATASPTPEAPAPAAPSTVTIQPNNAVSIGEGTSQEAILLRGLTEELRSSQVVSITFVFRNAGSVTVPVPVADPGPDVEPPPTLSPEPEEE